MAPRNERGDIVETRPGGSIRPAWDIGDDVRYAVENARSEVVSYVKPLEHKVLAHTASAIIDEKSAIIMGSVSVNGPQRVIDIRNFLVSRGINLRPGQFIHDDASGAMRRLESFGFIETNEGVIRLKDLGEGLGVNYTGQMLDYSSIRDRSMADPWSRPTALSDQSEQIRVPGGTIEYTKRPAELRIMVIEDLVRRSAHKQLPIVVADLAHDLQKYDPTINRKKVFDIVEEYVGKGIVSYKPGDGPKEFKRSETAPDEPPERFAGSQPLTMEVYKYIVAGPDEFLTVEKAINYILQRFPERQLFNQDHLTKYVRIILNEYCSHGYIDQIMPGVSLSGIQKGELSDLVVRLRAVQNRNGEGASLLQKLFRDRERLQTVVDKAAKN